MSYDLMVFAPLEAPPGHAQFMEWYERQTRWEEPHDYNDYSFAKPQLQAWFLEIACSFPPLNGPLSSDDLPDDESSASDYSIGTAAIYVAFAWSKMKPAHDLVVRLAAKHQLGFFNVSSGGEEVWLPREGALVLAHAK